MIERVAGSDRKNRYMVLWLRGKVPDIYTAGEATSNVSGCYHHSSTPLANVAVISQLQLFIARLCSRGFRKRAFPTHQITHSKAECRLRINGASAKSSPSLPVFLVSIGCWKISRSIYLQPFSHRLGSDYLLRAGSAAFTPPLSTSSASDDFELRGTSIAFLHGG